MTQRIGTFEIAEALTGIDGDFCDDLGLFVSASVLTTEAGHVVLLVVTTEPEPDENGSAEQRSYRFIGQEVLA